MSGETHTALTASSLCDLLDTSDLRIFRFVQMIMWPISVYNCDLNNFFRSIRYNADDDVDAHQLGWDDEEQLGVLHHERGHAGQDRVASLNIIVRQLCL